MPAGRRALAVFQGPHGYVSPSWYATKRETGEVVPTWNYAVVHAHGRLRAVDDPEWVRALVGRLTDARERGLPHPWRVEDAPAGFVRNLSRAVVGVELVVTRLVGKWKVSQNRPGADRAGVVAGLRSLGSERASELADLIPLPDEA